MSSASKPTHRRGRGTVDLETFRSQRPLAITAEKAKELGVLVIARLANSNWEATDYDTRINMVRGDRVAFSVTIKPGVSEGRRYRMLNADLIPDVKHIPPSQAEADEVFGYLLEAEIQPKLNS